MGLIESVVTAHNRHLALHDAAAGVRNTRQWLAAPTGRVQTTDRQSAQCIVSAISGQWSRLVLVGGAGALPESITALPGVESQESSGGRRRERLDVLLSAQAVKAMNVLQNSNLMSKHSIIREVLESRKFNKTHPPGSFFNMTILTRC